MTRMQFGEFVLDEERRELSRDGQPVHLSPKAFDLLAILIGQAPRAVPKETIYEGLWPDTIVEPANLNNLVSEVRGALGDEAKEIIRTKPRFGYSFDAELVGEPSRQAPSGRIFRIAVGNRAFDLTPGRNLIGREDDCTIVIDSPEVSRYHAVVEIGPPGATLEDLGSRNGTFLAGKAVSGRVRLEDGSEIEIGRTMLRYRTFVRKPTTISDPRGERTRQ